MTGIFLPKISEYDPVTSAEGALDPLGLYSIADRLAIRLVPGIRERMQHPRFLTAMAVGSLFTKLYDEDSIANDGITEPYLVYEWHMVEGSVRTRGDDPNLKGFPGTLKTKRCLFSDKMNLNASRYLKTASVFGFHGVYRLLADNLDIIKKGYLGERGYELLTVWEKEQGLNGFINGISEPGAHWYEKIKAAIDVAMKKGIVSRSGSWEGWHFFGKYLFPNEIPDNEGSLIKDIFFSDKESSRCQVLKFLTSKKGVNAWETTNSEKEFHEALSSFVDNNTRLLLEAIKLYELFSRLLQDAFDDCLAAMTNKRAKISSNELAETKGCQAACHKIPILFPEVADLLENFHQSTGFHDSFASLSQSLSPSSWTIALLQHHIKVQRQKAPHGKNPWFERFDDGAYIIRPAYKRTEGGRHDDTYVHFYRTNPLWSFAKDLRMV